MKNLIHKLRSAWYLLFSDRFILIYINAKDEQEDLVNYSFHQLKLEDIVFYCDTVAEAMEEEINEANEQQLANHYGKQLKDMIINQNMN